MDIKSVLEVGLESVEETFDLLFNKELGIDFWTIFILLLLILFACV